MISGYFGLPGSGKSTFLTMLAQKELRRIRRGRSKYKRVFTNFYCDGCYRLDYADLGSYNIEDSLVLLDEITLDADSRNFKQFDLPHKQFFLLHRHYGVDVIYFTQQYDAVDKKIRDNTQELWYVKKFLWWSNAKRIYRILDINEQTKEIVQGYRFPNFVERIFFHPRKGCFRPLYYKYFDSYERIPLPPLELVVWEKGEEAPPA